MKNLKVTKLLKPIITTLLGVAIIVALILFVLFTPKIVLLGIVVIGGGYCLGYMVLDIYGWYRKLGDYENN